MQLGREISRKYEPVISRQSRLITGLFYSAHAGTGKSQFGLAAALARNLTRLGPKQLRTELRELQACRHLPLLGTVGL